MSWDCYCRATFSDCRFDYAAISAQLQPAAGCEGRQRTDYPDCHLLVLELNNIGRTQYVFDARTGSMVGTTSSSDTSPYACPSDPQVTGQNVRTGIFPEPGCRSVSCGGCWTQLAPCQGGDAGADRGTD
jgi:hypothetical protein